METTEKLQAAENSETKEEMEAQRSREREIFGSFFLGASEFAVSVAQVQEVVNTPERYTNVPLAPPYLLGLFNLRGMIVPVVDLRGLLILPRAEGITEQKVAILESGSHCLGVIFDRTGEIFRSQAEERSEFAEKGRSAVLRGVFKKDGGRRLIQILDVEALFALNGVPKDAEAKISAAGRGAQRNRRGPRRQCISFHVGPAKCSLGIGDIREIIKVEKMHDTALGVGNCIGVIDLRGATVPVIDFAALLGYREKLTDGERGGDRRIIVMRLENELFGLLVDGIDSIVSYFDDNLKPFPAFSSSRREMFKACISADSGEDILLLNHEGIFSHGEIQEITRGHSKIYQARQETNERAGDSGARSSFITFKVGGVFAVRIAEVKEIIEMPEKLLHPPGLPKYCRGVLNLRGDLVTIVDARALYAVEIGEQSSPKVMVFRSHDCHFGLVVDSVEGIVAIGEDSKCKLPELLYGGVGGMARDVSEAIRCPDGNGNFHDLLILKSEAIGSRLKSA